MLMPLQAPKSKSLKAAANMFISILGAGVLGLPFAFRQSGLSQGVIVMIIIALLNIHCMMLLVGAGADMIPSETLLTRNVQLQARRIGTR